MSYPKEYCPDCDVELEDIVPSVKDRLQAAKIGQAGTYDPETGAKKTVRRWR